MQNANTYESMAMNKLFPGYSPGNIPKSVRNKIERPSNPAGKYMIGNQCAAPERNEGIFHPATVQAVRVTEQGEELLR